MFCITAEEGQQFISQLTQASPLQHAAANPSIPCGCRPAPRDVMPRAESTPRWAVAAPRRPNTLTDSWRPKPCASWLQTTRRCNGRRNQDPRRHLLHLRNGTNRARPQDCIALVALAPPKPGTLGASPGVAVALGSCAHSSLQPHRSLPLCRRPLLHAPA
jgi:hypothetical protein